MRLSWSGVGFQGARRLLAYYCEEFNPSLLFFLAVTVGQEDLQHPGWRSFS